MKMVCDVLFVFLLSFTKSHAQCVFSPESPMSVGVWKHACVWTFLGPRTSRHCFFDSLPQKPVSLVVPLATSLALSDALS